jgi:hypothetical protein
MSLISARIGDVAAPSVLAKDRRTKVPGALVSDDFTIEDDASGITYYGEHLGLLSDPAYAQRRATKRKAYLADGVQPIDSASGANRILIETTEAEGSGLDILEIERLARIVLG